MRSCLCIVLVALLITMVVEDVLGWGVAVWGKQKRKRDVGDVAFKLNLPCGIEKYDDNNDGYLDVKEFAKAAKSDSTHPVLNAAFKSFDKDGDSKLSIEEQILAMPEYCAKKEMEAIMEKTKTANV